MILTSTTLDLDAFERGTGWRLEPRGACKGDVCVPLGPGPHDVAGVAERLGMALVHDERAGLWALGPETVGGRALTTARAPDLTLPDRHGDEVSLVSFRRQKVLLVAWASW